MGLWCQFRFCHKIYVNFSLLIDCLQCSFLLMMSTHTIETSKNALWHVFVYSQYDLITNFQAFISQKYGDRPLPSAIPADEYEKLQVTLRAHKNRDTRAAGLLDDWYRRDDNSVPPAYLLARVGERLPDYFSVSFHSNQHIICNTHLFIHFCLLKMANARILLQHIDKWCLALQYHMFTEWQGTAGGVSPEVGGGGGRDAAAPTEGGRAGIPTGAHWRRHTTEIPRVQ